VPGPRFEGGRAGGIKDPKIIDLSNYLIPK